MTAPRMAADGDLVKEDTGIKWRRMGKPWWFAILLLTMAARGGRAYDYNAILDETLLDEGYYQSGDITIGAVLPIHTVAPAGEWGDITRSVAVMLFYSVRYAVDRINRSPDILVNTTLGLHVRDHAASPSTGVVRALQVLTAPEIGPLVMSGTHPNRTYQAVAVLGPPGTRTSLPVAAVTTNYRVLMVSPSAAGDSISNRRDYPYFYTPLPKSSTQDDLLWALVKYFKWKLFVIVYVSLEYAINSVQYFSTVVKGTDYCVENSYLLFTSRGQENYREIAEKLKYSKSSVVLFFTDGDYVDPILKELNDLGVTKRFFWLSRNVWTLGLFQVTQGQIQGSLYTRLTNFVDEELVEYLSQVSPLNYPEDSWLREFWLNTFGCAPEVGDDGSCDDHVLADLLVEDDHRRINNGVAALYSIAFAIDKVVSTCPEAAGNPDLLHECVHPTSLPEVMEQVEVVAPTRTFHYVQQYTDASFEIYQMQMNETSGRIYKHRIGTYFTENTSIIIDDAQLDFAVDGTDIPTQENATTWPESVCSHPCGVGEFRIQGELPCCWECFMCRDFEYVDDTDTGCVTCPPNMWPDNETRKFCVDIEPTYLLWSDPYGLTLSCLGAVGSVSSILILGIVIGKRECRVIKGSTWYMLVIILLGIKLANACVYIHIAMPTDAMCITARLGFHLAFTLIFGPLMVKVNRIFQVFLAASKLSRKVHMASDLAQQVMVTVIIIIQLAISLSSLFLWPAESVISMPVRTEKFTELHCSVPVNSLFICSSFNMFLLLACSILAFLARSLPDNFNESWYIFLSVATTVFIWIAFFTTYLSAFYAYHQAALLAAALILNALVVTVALFAPKIYALLYIPEKDIKVTDFNSSNFTRSTKLPPSSVASSEDTKSSTNY